MAVHDHRFQNIRIEIAGNGFILRYTEMGKKPGSEFNTIEHLWSVEEVFSFEQGPDVLERAKKLNEVKFGENIEEVTSSPETEEGSAHKEEEKE